jgi:hypothetical protein
MAMRLQKLSKRKMLTDKEMNNCSKIGQIKIEGIYSDRSHSGPSPAFLANQRQQMRLREGQPSSLQNVCGTSAAPQTF